MNHEANVKQEVSNLIANLPVMKLGKTTSSGMGGEATYTFIQPKLMGGEAEFKLP